MTKLRIADLFAGCGGLSHGFCSSDSEVVASVEWEKPCIDTIRANASGDHVHFHVDMRSYGDYLTNPGGLLDIAERDSIDGIVGGPPCQAYSLAGRIRCPDGMRDDYRNYLFEAYIEVLKTVQPKFFVFENVMGMLSAKPGGVPVIERLAQAFEAVGFSIPKIDKKVVFDLAELGGPQYRKRVILFGVNKRQYTDASHRVEGFYSNLNAFKTASGNVFTAIGDLPKLFPLAHPEPRKSHSVESNDPLHISRFHNARDIETFRMLASDAQLPEPKYRSIDALKDLYTERTGKTAAVHKYFVLYPDRPSNLIPAHLYKDGLRHIHYDPAQARSITMREAARLQTFPDSFKFVGSQTDIFKMIGNAVPPLMASKIAMAVKQVI